MEDSLSEIRELLAGVIVPHLRDVQISQVKQRAEIEELHRNFEDLCTEVRTRLAQLGAELATCRQEIEDAMVTLRESEAGENPDRTPALKKRLVH